MSITISNHYINELDRSNSQDVKSSQNGFLKGRIVSFIALGTATALSLTGAVVATLFAAYLLAAIFAAAALLSIAATVLTGRIKIVQPSTTNAPQINIQKEPETNSKENFENENLELKKQITDLKASLEDKFPIEEVESLKQELLQKQTKIEEQELDIENLRTENQNLLTELENIKISQDKLKIEVEDLDDKSSAESVNSEVSTEKETNHENLSSVISEISNEEISQHSTEKKFHKIKKRLFKSNKNKKELNLTPKEQQYLTRDLIPNNISKKEDIIQYFTIMKEIEKIEQLEEFKESFDVLKESEKKIKDILTEFRQTEIQFFEGMKTLHTFLNKGIESKVLNEEFSEITANLDILINESQSFIGNLPENLLSIEECLKMYYKATYPQTIQKYYEAFLTIVPKFNFIRESLTQISEKGKGKKLIEGFNNRPDGLCIFDFSIKIVQRFPKYVLMMQELINSSKFSQKQKEALEKNLSYMKLTIKRMNILTPRIDTPSQTKKRISAGSQSSEK